MAPKKLSSGFASSATRGMSGIDKEVESRIKKLDVFTDDFSPPGTSELVPGQNPNKANAPYGKPHDDFVPEADPQFWAKCQGQPWAKQLPDKKMHSAGDPADQEKMDWLDEMANALDAPLKNPFDQFPGTIDMEDHREEAKFDDHLTDPTRLKKMADKKIDGPEGFHKEVEKRMKRLAVEGKKPEAVKIVSEYQKDDQYNPDPEGKKNPVEKDALFNLK